MRTAILVSVLALFWSASAQAGLLEPAQFDAVALSAAAAGRRTRP